MEWNLWAPRARRVIVAAQRLPVGFFCFLLLICTDGGVYAANVGRAPSSTAVGAHEALLDRAVYAESVGACDAVCQDQVWQFAASSQSKKLDAGALHGLHDPLPATEKSFHLRRKAGDTTVPTLTAFDFAPDVVDVSSGSAQLTLSAAATDDLSGIGEVVVWLDRSLPDGFPLIGLYWWSGAGSKSRTLTLPAHTANGIYNITHVWVEDGAQNRRTLYPADLQALGFDTSFKVVGSTGDELFYHGFEN